MNVESRYQFLNRQVIDIEEHIIQLEQVLIHLEQCYLISFQMSDRNVSNSPVMDFKLAIEQQKIAIGELEATYKLAIEELESATQCLVIGALPQTPGFS